ncbi:hypothetical protein DFJ73DRAFT_940158 [Zopfochytrium polystomum]|nr:hypothetical protein DFJ73DRAFT_940158 [Zopfochytrium polystomum]
MYDWGLKTEYAQTIGSDILAGVYVNSGTEIDALGVVFVQPVSFGTVVNTKWGTVYDGLQVAPSSVHVYGPADVDNTASDTILPVNSLVTTTYVDTSAFQLSFTEGTELGMSWGVEASVPELGKATEGFTWKISFSSQQPAFVADRIRKFDGGGSTGGGGGGGGGGSSDGEVVYAVNCIRANGGGAYSIAAYYSHMSQSQNGQQPDASVSMICPSGGCQASGTITWEGQTVRSNDYPDGNYNTFTLNGNANSAPTGGYVGTGSNKYHSFNCYHGEIVKLEVPRCFGPHIRNDLRASPTAVPLHALNQFYYAFGMKMVDLTEDAPLSQILSTAFTTRLIQIMKYCHANVGPDRDEFLQRLDETEKTRTFGL